MSILENFIVHYPLKGGLKSRLFTLIRQAILPAVTLLLFSGGLSTVFAVFTADPETGTSEITGEVIDAETLEPVRFAYLHLEELNRTTTTDRDGKFTLRNVPEGSYTISVHRIGYVTLRQSIRVGEDETLELRLEMRSTILSGQAVQVVADAEETVGAGLEHASIKIVGEKLRRDLDATLSATLNNQAGFSERSMGVAPGRPVIRGLGDERVLILEDGARTGDVSWTSGDHAVTVDPAGADEIEIARGPAALEHGAGAIGGVINVVRNQIPNTVPSQVTGTASLQATSVNQGLLGGGSVKVPWRDNLALNLDFSGRHGSDVNTPIGRLENSWLRTSSNAFGAGYIRSWGYAGLSGSMYLSEYGIPPDPEGGHPMGVEIEMSKYQTEARTEILRRGSRFNVVEARGSYIYYDHSEIEPGGILGTAYNMETVTGSLKFRNRDLGPFDKGVVGIWGEYIDYEVFGSRTPNSNSWSGSIFAIQEADIGNLHLEGGLRLNHVTTRPRQERVSPIIGLVRERNFTGLESSASAIYDFGSGFFLGSTFMHSWRAPSLEELYSEGPHLAAYAYEIGNPNLDVERGLGSELFARYNTERTSTQLSAYYNHFRNYLHAQDTGRPSIPRADLNEFQYVGTRASMYGVELSSELKLLDQLALEGNATLTIGDRVVTEEEKEATGLEYSEQPLPLIPPFNGNIGVRYALNSFTITGKARFAASQDRLGEFETPTDGYAIFDLNAEYRFSAGTTFHTISLSGQNLLNTEYYNHLSLVKDLFAEPGRSVNLLYRIYF